jgi:NADPH-dependent ferric siderophore reductase
MSTPPAFTLQRERLDPRFRLTTLVSRRWITADYVRIRVEGDDLVGFGTPGHDDHVRIFMPAGRPETAEKMREFPSREFTPLHWGEDWLDLEFAVHGNEGVAGVWAATASLGSLLGVGGPRGSMRIDGNPDAWFLAGDETAIPQIRRYAALIPPGTSARILVEVRDAAHEVPIDAPVEVEYVHRGPTAAGAALSSRLSGLSEADRPAGDVFAFIAAEQSIVTTGRVLALDRWGLDPERVVVKGYWKREKTGTSHNTGHEA